MTVREEFINKLISEGYQLGFYEDGFLCFSKKSTRETIAVLDERVVFAIGLAEINKFQSSAIDFEEFNWDHLSNVVYRGSSKRGWKLGYGVYTWGDTYMKEAVNE